MKTLIKNVTKSDLHIFLFIVVATLITLVPFYLAGFEIHRIVYFVTPLTYSALVGLALSQRKINRELLIDTCNFISRNFIEFSKLTTKILVVILLLGQHPNSSDQIIYQLQSITSLIFITFLIFWFGLQAYKAFINSGHNIPYFVGRLLTALMLYAIAMNLLGHYGSQLSNYVIQNPQPTIVFILSFFIVRSIVKFALRDKLDASQKYYALSDRTPE